MKPIKLGKTYPSPEVAKSDSKREPKVTYLEMYLDGIKGLNPGELPDEFTAVVKCKTLRDSKDRKNKTGGATIQVMEISNIEGEDVEDDEDDKDETMEFIKELKKGKAASASQESVSSLEEDDDGY